MKTAKKAKPAAGKDVALKGAGDLSGPFQLTPAALAAKTPAALGLREGSARWALMKYAYAHPRAPLDRADLERIAGAQLTQALSGCVRYRFLTSTTRKQK
jgi:hypothetical protein